MPNAPAPTLVSTFEVLFTQQFPSIPQTLPFAGGNEFVIKGYFLTIANPNSAQYVFNVGFHCDPPGTGDRGLAATSPFLDSSMPGGQPSFGSATLDGTLPVIVPARGTVLLGLLPRIFPSSPTAPKPVPDIDVRGWVDITLPALLKLQAGLFYQPQSSSPVPVIVTAEQRLTFLTPGAGAVLTGETEPSSTVDFKAVEAQGAFALPLAAGMSSFAIPPQPGFSIIVRPGQEVSARAAALIDAMVQQDPEDMAGLFGEPAKEPAGSS